ncbi:hypothetical protein BT67DRAFT_12328 [Trichocladium antarcticum]|uniref:TeaA receptor TeaR n=1 Tax=Trichocladium antarcticum TaxID=1450529 RepID=A0AAN6UTB1_9PEZI|nr:hypothetical protein BT67DRAFT_12328 [Trichocladium antarcticum]
MATVSQTATTLASPAYVWENALPAETEALPDEKLQAKHESTHLSSRPPLALQNGNSTMHHAATTIGTSSPSDENGESAFVFDLTPNGVENSYLPEHEHKNPQPRSIKDHATSAESSSDPGGGTKGDRVEDAQQKKGPGGLRLGPGGDENSKWIHRDKLARIESEELQAAGIFLPRQRDRARSKSQNRSRREPSQDKGNGSGRSIGGSEQAATRSRKNSAATSSDTRTLDITPVPSWDLRLPEEIMEEVDGSRMSSSGKGSSRIPVAKISPVPIPSEHIARDTRLARKRDSSPGEEDSITYPKTRARSGSTTNTLAKAANPVTVPPPNKRADVNPKKPISATAIKKPKPANGVAGRPRTRGGPSKDSTSSKGTGTTRPTTRSGERDFSTSNSKPMEGEPPWMVSSYRPDPRLPPDQQLLPTVAKRLQQEKWEREGKFGSVYDKEFRPLTDVGLLDPPEHSTATDKQTEEAAEKEGKKEDGGPDWPLKPEAKSPTLPGRTNSYSTMPKIADKSTVASPVSPGTPGPQPRPIATVKVPEAPEEPSEKKGGCGCCIVM